MPEIPKPVVDYTARDYQRIKDMLSEYVQGVAPSLWTDFFESNLGLVIIDMIALTGDVVSYGQDTVAQEVFLSTARRIEGPLRFARSVGYTPRSAVSAQVVVRSGTLPQNLVLFGGVIEAGLFVTGTNRLRYEVLEEVVVPPGQAVLTLSLREGTSYSESFDPTRAARQEFTTTYGIVEDTSWSVFVGDTTDPDNEWEQVADVSLETSATETYEVYFDGDGKLHVLFGDGNSGQIPDDTVTVQYRTSNGADGNSAQGTIRGNIRVDVVGGQTASIAVENVDGPATGGQNPEGVEELRRSIPNFIRALDKVTSVRDYSEGLETLAGVALAIADTPLSSFQGNIVRVYVWDVEQVTFVSSSTESGLSSATVYNRYVQVPTTRVYAVQQYLKPRTITTVHNIVVRPTVAQVDLFLGRVTYDKTRFTSADVHQGIVDAAVALFEGATGFAIRIADIYSAILGVPGVKWFTIERVIFEHIDFDAPPTVIIEDLRSDQDSDGSEGGPFEALRDLVIPGATSKQFYDDAFLFDNETTYDGDVDNPNLQSINLRTLNFDLKTG